MQCRVLIQINRSYVILMTASVWTGKDLRAVLLNLRSPARQRHLGVSQSHVFSLRKHDGICWEWPRDLTTTVGTQHLSGWHCASGRCIQEEHHHLLLGDSEIKMLELYGKRAAVLRLCPETAWTWSTHRICDKPLSSSVSEPKTELCVQKSYILKMKTLLD